MGLGVHVRSTVLGITYLIATVKNRIAELMTTRGSISLRLGSDLNVLFSQLGFNASKQHNEQLKSLVYKRLSLIMKVSVKPILQALILQTPAESIHSLQTFLNICHSSGVTNSDVIIRTEGNSRNRSYFFGLEQTGTEIC